MSLVTDGKDIRKDNWFLDVNKTKRVMSEVIKIEKYFESHIPNLAN
ncbi:hypothetical protein [Caloranaerobacter sp. DY30410]